MAKEHFASTNQKYYPDLGNDRSSVQNFCARCSHFFSQETSVMASQKVGFSLRLKQAKPFSFVGSWKNDITDDSFHGFSSSACSVSLNISLLFPYANNRAKYS